MPMPRHEIEYEIEESKGNIVKRVIIAILALAALPNLALAADAKAGEAKANTVCAACHGLKGVSTNPLWPNLAGQKDQYFIKQMKDFRDGKRADPVMAPMAVGLSDADIENLAAFYAALPPSG